MILWKLLKEYRKNPGQNEYTVVRLWLVLRTGIQFMKMGIFGSQYFKFFLHMFFYQMAKKNG